MSYGFHPATERWFTAQFNEPTAVQRRAWGAIAAEQNVLIAAPTGSGKTLAAFLSAIDELVKEGEASPLPDEVRVLYVSPLKALSNDINRNLNDPIEGIQAAACAHGLGGSVIRSAVRTGDTSAYERSKMVKKPPHILVTTPESLYILLTSLSGREMLATVQTLIVDEIHALLHSKRGAHLALSIARLQRICPLNFKRIGLSATQRPIELVADYLLGHKATDNNCSIIDEGHAKQRDLEIVLPESNLDAVMAGEVWQEIYNRLEELIKTHKTTLIFVNKRRMAERMAKALAERIGEEFVAAHHGSLAKEHRFSAEQRLKSGQLRALVATASLELGIDIGDVDLVCQIESPRAISVFLQRVGRSGHHVGGIPKGKLFPTSRDDLAECVALLGAIQEGELDVLAVYPQPLDVLAQQIVAEIAMEELSHDETYAWVRQAWPYQDLSESDFSAVVMMLAEGFHCRRGRRGAYLHYDGVNRMLRPRKGARLTALTNGGTIPDQFDYDVILQPQGNMIGTLNEDFSFESLPGDIFQLGNNAYRILKIELGKVFVQDANGQPPTIPFWFGEAPGRSDELSVAISNLRQRVGDWLMVSETHAQQEMRETYGVSTRIAEELTDYLHASWQILGRLPTHQHIVIERFFDEAGDQHLVLHSCFGSRINKAWGLALRKRFCRHFNFELQAAALEDTLILSLGSTHSFALPEIMDYLKPATVAEVLVQALLDAPMFPTHWRWNATIALAVRRFSGGRKTPPQFQRSDAEDLVAVVFPDQIACAENIQGEREIPEHPLIRQTIYDCTHDLMDLDGLVRILQEIIDKTISVSCAESVVPSPLSHEVLTARPYAFLDDGEAEERRTSLVNTQPHLSMAEIAAVGQISLAAIELVRSHAWPLMRDIEEVHDGLLILGGLASNEIADDNCLHWLDELANAGRAGKLLIADTEVWVATERLNLWQMVHQDCQTTPVLSPLVLIEAADAAEALRELVRMRLQSLGPVSAATMTAFFKVAAQDIDMALLGLQQEGYAMQGALIPDADGVQWCERGLLARIHRLSIKQSRARSKPVPLAGFMHYLLQWQGVGEVDEQAADDTDSLDVVLQQLDGYGCAAAAWENSVLPARLAAYRPNWLDMLCQSGVVSWCHLPTRQGALKRGPVKATHIAFCQRDGQQHWQRFARHVEVAELTSSPAQRIVDILSQRGALFFNELVTHSGMLLTMVETALAELVANGLVTSDGYAGMRRLLHLPKASSARVGFINNSNPRARGRGAARSATRMPLDVAGRWSLLKAADIDESREAHWHSVEYIAKVLLKRYGVVFRKLLDGENNLPPWRDLQYVYRRMEAREEVRGGHFVSGVSGEQFALPAALKLLAQCAKEASSAAVDEQSGWVIISAADPLNLTATLLPGERISALTHNRVLYCWGVPMAAKVADDIVWLGDCDVRLHAAIEQRLRNAFAKQIARRPQARRQLWTIS